MRTTNLQRLAEYVFNIHGLGDRNNQRLFYDGKIYFYDMAYIIFSRSRTF